MIRRDFIRRTSLGITGGMVAALPRRAEGFPSDVARTELPCGEPSYGLQDWDRVRAFFPLDRSYIHMAGLFLTSHPLSVGRSVETLREELDHNPVLSVLARWSTDAEVRLQTALYAGASPDEVGLTGSTTMGLGILLHGLRLPPGSEILQTTHDHSVMDRAISSKAEHASASVRKVSLYDDNHPEHADTQQVVERLLRTIRPETRVLAATWVHSKNGVKLPVVEMSGVVASVNARRNEEDQITFVLDGVHGFGVEDVSIPELGCHLFSSGTHKWIYGPRGTGMIWGHPRVHSRVTPVIPSLGGGVGPWGARMTPGGFHAFEHRWAIAPAYALHLEIGKSRVQSRIHDLSRQLKEGLEGLPHVRVYTPRLEELSSGIVCFDVEGRTPQFVVDALLDKHRIIASTTPYEPSHVRLTPGLMNNEEDVEACLRALRDVS